MPYDYHCRSAVRHVPRHCKSCQVRDCDTTLGKYLSAAHGAADDEPQTVFRSFFSPAAVGDWAKYFARYTPKLKYAGVFTHQRPRCSFNAPPPAAAPAGSYSCELADVLLVLTDNVANRRKAGLLQAKMAAGWPPAGKIDQWYLYTGWPEITYNPDSSNPAMTRVRRTLPFTGGMSPCAQYLSIDLPAATAETNEAILTHAPRPFADFVDEFLNGTAGRTFAWSRSRATDDWDELVWDLLDYTWHQATGKSASHGTKADRGQGVYFARVADAHAVTGAHEMTSMMEIVPPTEPPDFRQSDEVPGWGIPIVHLIREGRNAE